MRKRQGCMAAALAHHGVKRFLEHLVGPAGSFIFHVLLILLAIRFIAWPPPKEPPAVEFVYERALPALDLDPVDPRLDPPGEEPVSMDVAMPEFTPADPEAPRAEPAALASSADIGMPMHDAAPDIPPESYWPETMGTRDDDSRDVLLDKHNRAWRQKTEKSVVKALDWLKLNQLPDGSWEGPQAVAMTGLGVLTFLAHGETTSSKPYGVTVRRAIEYLVSAYNNGGGGTFSKSFVPGQGGQGGDREAYAHGIATYAISEAYALTRIPELKSVMEGATQTIVQGQQAGGLWDYRFEKGARWDLSVSGWQMQALKAAYTAGAEVPGLKEAMEKAVVGTKRAQDSGTGRFGYAASGEGNDAMTGVGVLCLQLLGHSRAREARTGLLAMRGWDCDWNKAPPWGLYAWYYISQARFHEGGSAWAGWNNKLAPTLTKAQNADGSWPAPTARDGSAEEKGYGPVYSTTLAALTLQVYYRQLPTYRPPRAETREEWKDPVTVEII
jgi:hypothetical protein